MLIAFGFQNLWKHEGWNNPQKNGKKNTKKKRSDDFMDYFCIPIPLFVRSQRRLSSAFAALLGAAWSQSLWGSAVKPSRVMKLRNKNQKMNAKQNLGIVLLIP